MAQQAPGLTWQVTATSTPAPLAVVWAPSTSYPTAGVAAVFPDGSIGRVITPGTSGPIAPTFTGPAVADGVSLVWERVPKIRNSLSIKNTDASTTAFWSWDSTVSTTTGDAMPPSGSNVTIQPRTDPDRPGQIGSDWIDPSGIYVVTPAAHTAVLTIASMV